MAHFFKKNTGAYTSFVETRQTNQWHHLRANSRGKWGIGLVGVGYHIEGVGCSKYASFDADFHPKMATCLFV